MTILGTLQLQQLSSFHKVFAERAVKKIVLKSNNAQQFMPHFYFVPLDGKFGQSLMWPDDSSDAHAKNPTVQKGSLNSY